MTNFESATKQLFLGFLVASAFYCPAQTQQPAQKIGHADWEYIFRRMPEYKQIEAELRAFDSQLQNQLNSKRQEFATKYKAYQELPANTPDAIRKDKESELAYAQENIVTFEQEAQLAMQKKQQDLVKPVLEKVGKAIEGVALENQFTYIITPQMVGAGNILLFADEKYDVSDLVLEKLGAAPK